ncbi:MAG: FtsX-like permease family protein [Pseudomonadales bacterium]
MTARFGAAAWIALRYLSTPRRQFATFVTRLSVAGLALGVLVLTVVVSVMNGFDAELRTRILGSVPHVFVADVALDDPLGRELIQSPSVRNAFNFFAADGMITARGAVNPVAVHGIDADIGAGLSMVSEHMVEGTFEDLFIAPRGLLLGAPLAAFLGLYTGDDVALVLTDPMGGSAEPRLLRFRVAGLFEIGAELDYSLVLIEREDLSPAEQAAFGETGVRVTLFDAMQAPLFAEALRSRWSEQTVRSWADTYGGLFAAVRLEKRMMFVLLLLVVAVAAFSIVSGQTMAVADKQVDIAILRTLGASTELITRVFLLQGLAVSSIGILAGLGAGALLAQHIGSLVASAEGVLGFRFLEGTYFVSVPSVVLAADLALIASCALGLCLLSAWLPARRAAGLDPLAGLHR